MFLHVLQELTEEYYSKHMGIHCVSHPYVTQ